MNTKTMNIALKDTSTKWGWKIKNTRDLVLAVLGYPYFQTVDSLLIEEAVESAAHDREEWNDVHELAQYTAETYI